MRPAPLMLLALAATLMRVSTSTACPACNIHNYLTSSVCSSRNVVIGKVVGPGEGHQGGVEVAKVLRGSHRRGEVVQMPGGTIGETYIFLDPRSWPPTFEVLDPSFEEEVTFLLEYGLRDLMSADGMTDPRIDPKSEHFEGPIPHIRNMDEAVRLVQGYANETRCLALAYLLRAGHHPADQLIAAIAQRRKEAEQPDHQIRCLVAALMLRPTDRGRQFVIDEVKAFIKADAAPIEGTDIPMNPSINGVLLEALLGATGETWSPVRFAQKGPDRKPDPRLRAEARELLLAAFPKLSPAQMADATYALCHSKVATTDELDKLLDPKRNREGFALGLYWIGTELFYDWERPTAREVFRQSKAITTQPALRDKLDGGLNRIGLFDGE